MLIKPKVSPLLHFSALCDIFGTKNSKISSFFSKKSLLRILSLRYSADFRRSRLVSFFRQATDLIVYVPRFSTDFSRFTVNQAVTGSSPCFSQNFFEHLRKRVRLKGPLFQFFRHCATFFRFFLPSKGPTFKFF